MDGGGTESEGTGLCGSFAEHQDSEGVLIPLDQHTQEGQLILLFYLHCELYLLAKAIEVIQEGDQLCSSMGQENESIYHVPN